MSKNDQILAHLKEMAGQKNHGSVSVDDDGSRLILRKSGAPVFVINPLSTYCNALWSGVAQIISQPTQ